MIFHSLILDVFKIPRCSYLLSSLSDDLTTDNIIFLKKTNETKAALDWAN